MAVVGHGISGLAAALAADEAGAEAVVVEKSPREDRGGHSRFAGGLFRFPMEDPEAVADALDLDRSPERYTREDFYDDLMAVSDGRADPELCRTLVEEAYEAVEWITGHGVTWHVFDTADEVGYGQHVGAVQCDGEGAGAVDALSAAVEDRGIDVHYDTEFRELRRDGAGRVAGAVAAGDEGVVEYDAPAVVVCAGSYVSSPERRVRYFGRDGDAYVVRGSRYNTGEALEAAIDAGAATGGQWGGAHQVMLDARAPQVEGGRTRINGYQYGLVLDERGERFVDEGEDFLLKTYAKLGQAVFDAPGHRAFVVYDDRVADLVMSQMGTDPLTAETLEGLFEAAGLDRPDRALETVREFNDACEPAAVDEFDPEALDGNRTRGLDPEKTNWAVPLADGPFHCFPVRSGITFAFGGLQITTGSEVLDTRGRPIPGLWAVGNSTSEFFYGNYPGGSALTRGTTFGRRAGTRAAEYAASRE